MAYPLSMIMFIGFLLGVGLLVKVQDTVGNWGVAVLLVLAIAMIVFLKRRGSVGKAPNKGPKPLDLAAGVLAIPDRPRVRAIPLEFAHLERDLDLSRKGKVKQ